MSYATPFYYAAKAVQSHESRPVTHDPLPARRRRRRIRLVLFPAQRPQATITPASSTDC